MTFDDLFDKSELPDILKKAKTLSKEECRAIYIYMDKFRPKKILEFGTQFGCSTRVFIEISKWINYFVELHSWDIIDGIRKDCIDQSLFTFHLKDVTGEEDSVVREHNPDLVFLDAHPYLLTKKIIQICLRDKINFMCHDVSLDIYERARKRSKNFTNYSPSTMAEWELYLLQELISKDILSKDFFENDFLTVRCIRDVYGLAIIGFKK